MNQQSTVKKHLQFGSLPRVMPSSKSRIFDLRISTDFSLKRVIPWTIRSCFPEYEMMVTWGYIVNQRQIAEI